MSGVSIDGAAVAIVTAGSAEAGPATPVPDRAAGWWRAWRDRFGLAEVCGTLAALAGFAFGYAQDGSLLAAAALATICEAIGFYGCIAAKTGAAARRATAHLGGWRRLAAGAWHAVREQLASCAGAAGRGVDRVRGGQGRRRRGLVRPGGLRAPRRQDHPAGRYSQARSG